MRLSISQPSCLFCGGGGGECIWAKKELTNDKMIKRLKMKETKIIYVFVLSMLQNNLVKFSPLVPSPPPPPLENGQDGGIRSISLKLHVITGTYNIFIFFLCLD